MKKRPLIVIQLFIISVLFITLATSCKKENDDTETVTDSDGNVYNTVTIGTQVWLKENLKTTKLNDGTPIPLVTDQTAWSNLKTMGYCWFMNDEATYGSDYGALYNWYAANNGKLCPQGWHVPTDAEWSTLINHEGGENIAGGNLKEDGFSHWKSPNSGAINKSGFTARPGSYRSASGTFANSAFGEIGYYWSTTEYPADWAYNRYFYHDDTKVSRSYNYKENGFSVRCIKD